MLNGLQPSRYFHSAWFDALVALGFALSPSLVSLSLTSCMRCSIWFAVSLINAASVLSKRVLIDFL